MFAVVEVDIEVEVGAFFTIDHDGAIESPEVQDASDHVLPHVFVFRARIMTQSQHPQRLQLHDDIELRLANNFIVIQK